MQVLASTWSAILVAQLVLAAPLAAQPAGTLRPPDVVYIPTPEDIVEAMLRLADVTETDVVYDLGSGDGRIPIIAAQKFGATGVGIEIDPERIKEANENLARAGVGDKVTFLNQDLFEADLSHATVITLYLLREMNLKLMPRLKALKPGTRIVAHSFGMGTEWPPDKIAQVSGKSIFYWVVK
jgi:cyclopropane fatty-acyl-phospholipid synthase-like methyltransferase